MLRPTTPATDTPAPRLAHPNLHWLAVDALPVLPALLGLGVAVGAACFALAHYVTDAGFTFALYSSLALSLAIAVLANCGTPQVARAAGIMRNLVLAFGVPAVLLANFGGVSDPHVEVENTNVVAILVGWSMVLAVLCVGAKFAEGKVDISAALVPGISLFGLLNIVLVDAEISVSFLIFLVAALYLVAYAAMLANRAALDRGQTGGANFATTAGTLRCARQVLAAVSIWFAVFLGGAGLVFYPLRALLPSISGAALSRLRASPRETAFDWHTASTTMEVHGGNHDLSPRPELRIRVLRGVSNGLWRGHVFDAYTGSEWQALHDQEGETLDIEPDRLTDLNSQLAGLHMHWPQLASTMGSARSLTASMQPLTAPGTALYTCGQPMALAGDWNAITIDRYGDLHTPPNSAVSTPYKVESRIWQPRLSGLLSAPGLTPAQLAAWRNDPDSAVYLALPDQPGAAQTISEIARGIESDAASHHQPLGSTYEKVLAVGSYLQKNCAYSLDGPLVPSTQDAVVYFLTQTHVGACDMFSSSMALLLRAMDVPARIATGYLEPDPDNDSSPGTYTYTVRERDAHAWVEYFVPGADWLSYDPSAGTRLATNNLTSQFASMFSMPTLRARWRLLVLPIAGFALLFFAGGWPWQLRRGTGNGDASLNKRRIVRAYLAARRQAARRVAWSTNLTPSEYEAAVHGSQLPAAFKREFAALTYLYIGASYAGETPPVEGALLNESLQRLRDSR